MVPEDPNHRFVRMAEVVAARQAIRARELCTEEEAMEPTRRSGRERRVTRRARKIKNTEGESD